MPTTTLPTQQDAATSTFAAQQERTICEVWTRAMGYHRPVQSFNAGKKAEYFSRNYFCEKKTENSSVLRELDF